MPIYEFICNECLEKFEELVFSTRAIAEVTCPACGSPHVEKKVSLFAARIVGGIYSGGESLKSTCGIGAHST